MTEDFPYEMPSNPVPASEPVPSIDQFLPEDEGEDLGIDPNQIITLRTSDGSSHFIAVEGATSLAELKRRSDLNFGGNVQVFLNGAVITDDAVVPTGATIVAVGSVKGG